MLDSADRRRRAQEELSKTSIDWDFLDAIDGRLLRFPIPEYPANKVENLLGFHLMPGEIGAFMSHKKAWELCIAAQKPTLILEDDFVVLPDFELVIDYLLTSFHDWDLIRLQALRESGCEVIQDAESFSVVKNDVDALGCTAYIVKPAAAKALLDAAQYIYEPIDHFIEHRSAHGKIFLAIKPYPVDISYSPTTVDRPERQPVRGIRKAKRSIYRAIDRLISDQPWFPRNI